MMNNTQSAVAKETRIQWPDMTKDNRAMELAKVALGWASMDTATQMGSLSRLALRAQEIKETL